MIQMKRKAVILAGALACAAVVSAAMPMQCSAAGALPAGKAFIAVNGEVLEPQVTIQGDGQYTVSCDTAALRESDTVQLWVENIDPIPLGTKGSTSMTVDSIQFNGSAAAVDGDIIEASKTDFGYSKDVFCAMIYRFTPMQSDAATNHLDVTFTVSNLIDPATYVPSNVSTVVATGTTTIESGSSSGASNGGSSVTGGSVKTSTSGSPKTGDAGVYGLMAVLVVSGGAAFLAKKKA